MTRQTDAAEPTAVIAEGIRRREEHDDPVGMLGLHRIEISVVEGLRYEARSPVEPDGRMHVGEPVERGGDGTGATPLSHFLTGTGACLLNQFVRVGIAEALPLRFTGALVRGDFRREAGGRFERITCEVRAEGMIGRAAAETLIARAERLCYVHQTLVAAAEVTTVLVVDGQEVGRHADGPPPAAVSPERRSPR